jgi:hypothetical protein
VLSLRGRLTKKEANPGPSGPARWISTESLILAQDERWRRA